jgi:hypothetical protein
VTIAHITNSLGQKDGDFDKGEHHGADASLAIASAIAKELLPRLPVKAGSSAGAVCV